MDSRLEIEQEEERKQKEDINLENGDIKAAQRSRRETRFGESRVLTHSICFPTRNCLSNGFLKSKSLQNSSLESNNKQQFKPKNTRYT